MFFHQISNSIGNQIYNAFIYKNVSWYLHLHLSYELCLVISGNVTVTVDNKEQVLHQGECVLIPPYVLHAYNGEKNSVCFIAVFSGSYVSSFDALNKNRKYTSYIFMPDEELIKYFSLKMGFANLQVPDETDTIKIETPDIFTLKSCLYSMIAVFNNEAIYQETKQDLDLISKILDYTQKHFTENITLNSLCNEIDYNYEYVSKIFNQTLKVNFKTLINQYRLELANEYIQKGEKTLSEIAFDSGFQSIRTFNRVYKQMTGHTPSIR